jgi:hypothetical protein
VEFFTENSYQRNHFELSNQAIKASEWLITVYKWRDPRVDQSFIRGVILDESLKQTGKLGEGKIRECIS